MRLFSFVETTQHISRRSQTIERQGTDNTLRLLGSLKGLSTNMSTDFLDPYVSRSSYFGTVLGIFFFYLDDQYYIPKYLTSKNRSGPSLSLLTSSDRHPLNCSTQILAAHEPNPYAATYRSSHPQQTWLL